MAEGHPCGLQPSSPCCLSMATLGNCLCGLECAGGREWGRGERRGGERSVWPRQPRPTRTSGAEGPCPTRVRPFAPTGQLGHPWKIPGASTNPWSIHQSLERVLTLQGQEEGFPQSLCFKPAPVRPMRVNRNTSGPGETLALSLHPGLSPSLPHSFQLFNFPSPWQHLKAGRLKYKSPPNHYEQDLSAPFRAVGPE